MRVGFWNIYPQLSTNNFCFKAPDAPIGDELLLPLNVLAERGRLRGIEFVTLDLVEDMSKLDAILFADYPDFGHPLVARAWTAGAETSARVPKYLLTFEPPTVRPENFQIHDLLPFRKVFTWDDTLIAEGAKYVKINYAQRFPSSVPSGPRPGFCALIASNKFSKHPLSLYPARIDTIRYFAENTRPGNAFHLYGPGWPLSPVNMGTITPGAKRKVLEKYRFSICYENARSLLGYITEKIFDSMIAGCVPVYLGAPNIGDYVPRDCFIDRRAFADDATLLVFLQTMPEAHLQAYRDAMNEFFESRAAYQFTPRCFADTILDTLAGQATPT